MVSLREITRRRMHFFNRHTTDNESRFHSHELETLAVVESLNRFRIYLLGKRFKVMTDCASLSTTKLTKPLPPRIARWWLKLGEYDFELVHRPGRAALHVDALSRQPVEPANAIETVGNDILRIHLSDEDWLLTMQKQDSNLKTIIETLQSSKPSSQVRADYCLKHGRLFRNTPEGRRWVVPNGARWRIVKLSHDDVGHPSLDRTLQRCRRKFWFPRMRNFIKSYLTSCIQCCYHKKPTGRHEGELHSMPRVPVPFYTVHLDHQGPYPTTTRRNTHILVTVDAFTKYVVIKAVKNTSSAPVIATLNEMSSYFGLSTNIVTDRGTAFTSSTFERYCRSNGIRHHKIAVRTPRANGQVERAHQVIRAALAAMVEKDERTWDKNIRAIQWMINTSVNATTKRSPHDLVFDYEPKDLLTNELILALHDDDKEGEPIDVNIQQKRQVALDDIEREFVKWKLRFDAKHKMPTEYQVDDLIVVQNEPAATGTSRKLEPRFKGPYVITKILPNDRYVVEDLPGTQLTQRRYVGVFSSDKMKRWCTMPPDLGEELDEDVQ